MAKFDIVTPIMLAHAYGTMSGGAPAQLYVAGLTQAEVQARLNDAEGTFITLPMMPHSGKQGTNPLAINRNYVIYVADEVTVESVKEDLLPNPGEEKKVVSMVSAKARKLN
jgi:hypothetical protein